MTMLLGLAWKDALQRNAEVQNQVRLHVEMRLTSARVGDRLGIHRSNVAIGMIDIGSAAQKLVGRVRAASCCKRRDIHHVCVRRHFGTAERVRLLSADFAQRVSAAHMEGHSSLKIRQGESGLPVPAVSRSEQGKQRLILIDRQQLPVAQRPALGGKVEAHDANF